MHRYGRGLCFVLAVLLVVGLAGCGKDGTSISDPFLNTPEFVPGEDGSTPSSNAQPESTSEAEPEVSQPESTSQESSSSSLPPQAAPVFGEGSPSVAVSGKTATVTIKTDVESTVNCILTTDGTGVGTGAFYDYFNRGKALSGAVSKKQVYNVTSAGASVSFELSDSSKAYYLLLNAAENATGTWQSGVTVLKLYDPGTSAPGFSGEVARGNDSGGNAVFTVKTTRAATVYAIVSAGDAPAPSAAEVKAGGTGYGGGAKIYASAGATTTGDKEPYSGNLSVPLGNLATGSYTLWVVVQQNDGPLSNVAKSSFKV